MPKIPSVFLYIIFSLAVSFHVRPAQDDYASLSALSHSPWVEVSFSHWNLWGGNIFTSLIATLSNTIHTSSFLFLGLQLHSLITFLLFGISALILCKWVGIDFFRSSIRTQCLIVLSWFLSILSLHSPAFAGMFSFAWASTGHLWPVMFLIISLDLADKRLNKFSFIFFILGIVICNFNVTEGFASLIVIGLRYFQKSSLPHQKLRFMPGNHLWLLFGGIIGFLLIIFAPGFNRRREVVGNDYSAFDFMARLFEASITVFGDVILHPGWLVGLILGVKSARRFTSLKYKDFDHDLFFILLVFPALLFCLTVFGGAAAYVSWYQTMGIYLFYFPLSFRLGTWIGSKITGPPRRPLLNRLSFILVFSLPTLLLSRDLIEIVSRSKSWDSAYEVNYCKILSGENDILIGASILYPPLNLGISDIDTRPWMKDLYVDWIQNSGNFDIKC
jgi:hypothetical protein